MSKRLLIILAALAAGAAPANAGEDIMPMAAGAWERSAGRPNAGGDAPMRRLTSNDVRLQQPEPQRRNAVKLTLPSLGSDNPPSYMLVDARQDGPDGALEFDLANAIPSPAPILDIPGVFSPDLLVMDELSRSGAGASFGPQTETGYFYEGLSFTERADDVMSRQPEAAIVPLEPLTPMEIPASLPPPQIVMPPPIVAGPFSPTPVAREQAMAAPLERVPHTTVRLKAPSTAALEKVRAESTVAEASPSASQPQKAEPTAALRPPGGNSKKKPITRRATAPPTPVPSGSLKPPPGFAPPAPRPEPEEPRTSAPPPGPPPPADPNPAPAALPQRDIEYDGPVDEYGFVPLRAIKSF